MKDMLFNLITSFLGLIAIVIFSIDLFLKRRASDNDFKLRQDIFDEEKKESEQRRIWLERETARLTNFSDTITNRLIYGLKTDITWASEALVKAKLQYYSNSLFGDRFNHFIEEKQILAEKFIPDLLNRCEYLCMNNKVFLIIDSGTTLYFIMKSIGSKSILDVEHKPGWLENLTIVTNNLPGVQVLMEDGRSNPYNRYSDLSIKCKLLPGKPVPVFSAVLGEETEVALKSLKSENEDSIFIGLVTGNWIFIDRNGCPTPLARGDRHKEFKNTIIEVSNEIYIISPLGKVFKNVELFDINKGLGSEKDAKYLEKTLYEAVTIPEDKVNVVKLISTSRTVGRVLSSHFISIAAILGKSNKLYNQTEIKYNEILDHQLYSFSKFPDIKALEIEQEFPHANTRKNDFMGYFFSVDSA